MDILNAALNINQSHENDVLARLTTVWGENLNPEHVLEEYPRPQLKRDNYTILNGYWNYAITRTPDIPEAYDGKILVPFSPESILSGVENNCSRRSIYGMSAAFLFLLKNILPCPLPASIPRPLNG